MELSVVIPTLKSRSDVTALRYLKQCDFDEYEVILRDDFPVTKARNEGYHRANSEKILFLDDDSMPRDGYLEEAANTLENEDAVAGRTVHPRNDIFAGQLTSHYEHGDQPGYVDAFWGCNMGIRREVLEDVGGWDENMGWGHEEKELARRVRESHEIYYNPDMVVDHVYAESLVDYWTKLYKLETQTPYFWQKQGISPAEIFERTVTDAINPLNYLGRTPSLAVARTGNRFVRAAGRLTGLFDQLTTASPGAPNGNSST